MEFVKKFTPPDFQAKNFTPSISPNFNSFSKKKHNKLVKMEKFTPLGKTLHCRRQWRHGQIPPLNGLWRELLVSLWFRDHRMCYSKQLGLQVWLAQYLMQQTWRCVSTSKKSPLLMWMESSLIICTESSSVPKTSSFTLVSAVPTFPYSDQLFHIFIMISASRDENT